MIKKILIPILLLLLLSACGAESNKDDPYVTYPATIRPDATTIVVAVSYSGFWSYTNQDALNFINNKLPGREVQGKVIGEILATSKVGAIYNVTVRLQTKNQ